MSVKMTKAARRSHRWAGWDGQPLEDRQLMSATPLAAEVRTQPRRARDVHRSGRVAGSIATYLTISNSSTVAVRIGISSVDSYDWDGDSRPDKNLQDVVLAPGQSTTQREEVNRWAQAQFTITLYDADSGGKLGSSRARYVRNNDVGDGIMLWTLSPQKQNFAHGGKTLAFSSAEAREDLDHKGVFTLAEATQARRAPLRRQPRPGRVASSFATYLTIANRSDVAVKIRITDIDSYDWDGDSRPDKNLQDVVLAPGQSTTQREEISRGTTPNFTISLVDAGTGEAIATARATMRWASSHDYQYRFWDLNPDYQKVSHDGRALSFYARLGSNVDPMTGAFILDEVAQSPRRRGNDGRNSGRSRGFRIPNSPNSLQATQLTINNRSGVAVRIGISEIDNYDWEGDSRPDHNLDGVVLAAGQSITRREDINGWAEPNFRITLYDTTTGASIGTARARYYAPLGAEVAFVWELNPTRQVLQSGGRSLIFRTDNTPLIEGRGAFILEDATSGRGAHRGRRADHPKAR